MSEQKSQNNWLLTTCTKGTNGSTASSVCRRRQQQLTTMHLLSKAIKCIRCYIVGVLRCCATSIFVWCSSQRFTYSHLLLACTRRMSADSTSPIVAVSAAADDRMSICSSFVSSACVLFVMRSAVYVLPCSVVISSTFTPPSSGCYPFSVAVCVLLSLFGCTIFFSALQMVLSLSLAVAVVVSMSW